MFKVGDKIRVRYDITSLPSEHGRVGVISDISKIPRSGGRHNLYILWDDYISNSNYGLVYDDEVELCENGLQRAIEKANK